MSITIGAGFRDYDASLRAEEVGSFPFNYKTSEAFLHFTPTPISARQNSFHDENISLSTWWWI